MKVLVVGSSGFVGTHLVAHLAAAGDEVVGWGRRAAPGGAPAWRFEARDLLDPAALDGALERFDGAVVLAANSVPGGAWTRERVLENVQLAARSLEHLARTSPGARVLLVSSAHVYAPGRGLRREDEAPAPRTLYGLSKVLCEDWARFLARDLDLHIVRPFNLLGAGMPRGLVATDLLERLRAGEDPVRMQGSDSTRDFLDVRDGVRGLAALLAVDAPSGSVWNLCSGQGLSIAALARRFLAELGLERRLEFAQDCPDELVGDPARLECATGWRPRHDLDATLREVTRRA